MAVTVHVRNESGVKRLYQRSRLGVLAERVCTGEGLSGDLEVSVLLCDDAAITRLNREYRNINKATDVLSFGQPPAPSNGAPRLLGDIVISLETVERECRRERSAMRDELYLLFCHGLLHLLGYDHQTAQERDKMAAKQAEYLGVPIDAAWHWVAAGHR